MAQSQLSRFRASHDRTTKIVSAVVCLAMLLAVLIVVIVLASEGSIAVQRRIGTVRVPRVRVRLGSRIPGSGQDAVVATGTTTTSVTKIALFSPNDVVTFSQ